MKTLLTIIYTTIKKFVEHFLLHWKIIFHNPEVKKLKRKKEMQQILSIFTKNILN